MSRSRASRRREITDLEDRIGPDQAMHVHTLDDGWTIHRLDTTADLVREGQLMRMCVGTNPDLYRVFRGLLHSLRDPDGFPHTVWMHVPDEGLSAKGEGQNSEPMKPEYEARIDEWHHTLPYPAEWVDPLDELELYAGVLYERTLADAVAEFRERLADLAEVDSLWGITREHLEMRGEAAAELVGLLFDDETETATMAD